MDGGHYIRSKSGFKELPALFCDPEFWPKQCLSCRGAEGHNNFRFDHGDLGLEPGTTSRDFLGVGFLVDATFATRLPLKMFDNIGDIRLAAIDAGFFERFIKEPAGGTDEGFACEVFFIAGLLTDEHRNCATRAFTKNCLRTSFPEIASF